MRRGCCCYNLLLIACSVNTFAQSWVAFIAIAFITSRNLTSSSFIQICRNTLWIFCKSRLLRKNKSAVILYEKEAQVNGDCDSCFQSELIEGRTLTWPLTSAASYMTPPTNDIMQSGGFFLLLLVLVYVLPAMVHCLTTNFLR